MASERLGVHPDTVRSLFDRGILKGSLTEGGQRMITVSSIQEEEARRLHRSELRKLELRAKKKNQKRREKSTQKRKEELLRKFEETRAELVKV